LLYMLCLWAWQVTWYDEDVVARCRGLAISPIQFMLQTLSDEFLYVKKTRWFLLTYVHFWQTHVARRLGLTILLWRVCFLVLQVLSIEMGCASFIYLKGLYTKAGEGLGCLPYQYREEYILTKFTVVESILSFHRWIFPLLLPFSSVIAFFRISLL
jgi:hypothetical protein